MGCFSHIPLSPKDPILGLTVAFKEDPRQDKINLGAGIYRNENLITPILESVKKAEELLFKQQKSKDYLPIQGNLSFCEEVGKLVFGKALWKEERGKIAAFQTLGGTGALAIGARFLKREAEATVYIPDPTWPNHKGIFTDAFLEVKTYPYYDSKEGGVGFEKFSGFLEGLPEGSIVLFHVCCHNPTGADFSEEQWEHIAKVCLQKNLIPFLDFAYQGFGRGIEQDAFALRLFMRNNLCFLVASSCSKSFSLYGERVGALFIVGTETKETPCVQSRVHQLIRTDYSSPPLHGALLVSLILQEETLTALWEKELHAMRERICKMRTLFTDALMAATQKRDFRYLKKSFGMFSFCGLSKQQTERLIAERGIYMTSDGRINLCGLTEKNLTQVVEGIVSVLCVE